VTSEWQRTLLRETLRLAVPREMDRLRSIPGIIVSVARESAEIVATHGDDLQFGGWHCARTFAALARGLAAAALAAEGGIDYLGLHWCSVPGCRAADRFEHAAPAAPDTGGAL
jgi:hypothetical protein